MKAKDVVGKRIVRVGQTYVPKEGGFRGQWSIDDIELDDGTIIAFHATEQACGDEPYPVAILARRGRS